jgi:hypothetical protein
MLWGLQSDSAVMLGGARSLKVTAIKVAQGAAGYRLPNIAFCGGLPQSLQANCLKQLTVVFSHIDHSTISY